jgi:hypothetical protein
MTANTPCHIGCLLSAMAGGMSFMYNGVNDDANNGVAISATAAYSGDHNGLQRNGNDNAWQLKAAKAAGSWNPKRPYSSSRQ